MRKKKIPHEDRSRERTNKDKPFRSLSMHTLAHDLKTAEAQAGMKQKPPKRFWPTKALTPRPRLSRQGPPVQQVLAGCPPQGLSPGTLFYQKPFPGNRINFTLHLGRSQCQMTDQAIWNGLTGGWGQRQLPWAFLSIGPPPPRHSHVTDSSQHPFRRYPCVSLFDQWGRGAVMSSCWDREILSKVKEPRAETPGCGCGDTRVVAVGRKDIRWILTAAVNPGTQGRPADVSTDDRALIHTLTSQARRSQGEAVLFTASLILGPSPAFSAFALKTWELHHPQMKHLCSSEHNGRWEKPHHRV